MYTFIQCCTFIKQVRVNKLSTLKIWKTVFQSFWKGLSQSFLQKFQTNKNKTNKVIPKTPIHYATRGQKSFTLEGVASSCRNQTGERSSFNSLSAPGTSQLMLMFIIFIGWPLFLMGKRLITHCYAFASKPLRNVSAFWAEM